MKPTTWLVIGSLFGAAGVALGAFGAHGLKSIVGDLSPDDFAIRREWFETAAKYHLIHALAIVAAGIIGDRHPEQASSMPGIAFSLGILIFSGMLYAMAVTGIRVLGAIVPIGGVAFIVGWLALAWSSRAR